MLPICFGLEKDALTGAEKAQQCLLQHSHSGTLFPVHLPSNIRVQVARSSVGSGPVAEIISSGSSVQRLPTPQDYRDAIYTQAEKQDLKDLMALTAENIPEACRISGLSQSWLYALLKKNSIGRQA